MPFLNQILRDKIKMRERFYIQSLSNLKWYPGHMDTSMRKMQSKLKSVDCVIEVHDARIPVSGRNPNFHKTLLGIKPHLLVLNKADLFDSSYKQLILRNLQRDNIENVLFTCCSGTKDANNEFNGLLPKMQKLLSNTNRFNRSSNREYNVMVIGVPNVGKSSLINNIRNKYLKKGKVAPVGPIAGVTRAVQSRIQVCPAPPIFVYDTPGILAPQISNVDTGMKLALCATLNDNVVGHFRLADYLIYWLNKNEIISYMDFFGVDAPSDDTKTLLLKYAIKYNLWERKNVVDGSGTGLTSKPSLDIAASHFIQAFREGRLGPCLLDMDILD